MFAVGGMMLFPAANDLLTMFVALEVFSLPLYLLCGLARRRRLISQEAAMKYFLLGAFSSAFFLYGIALVYGFAGSVHASRTSTTRSSSRSGAATACCCAGIGLLAVGLLFKVSAAPFHAWTPDVYQGAPTAVTAFMAACTKLAAFGALLRVFYVALGGARWDWQPMFWIVAVLTMAGRLGRRDHPDRHQADAGLLVDRARRLPAHRLRRRAQGVRTRRPDLQPQAVLFYLVAYGFTHDRRVRASSPLVRDAGGEATHLSRWAGLGKESPVLAGVFAFFLLAFAGHPADQPASPASGRCSPPPGRAAPGRWSWSPC